MDLKHPMMYSLGNKKLHLLVEFRKYNYTHLLPKAKNIASLEIGTGFGQFMKYMIEIGYNNVEGIDASKQIVDFCLDQKLKVKYVEDFISYFEHCKNKYDLIVANDILEHFSKEELTGLLININKCLNPGGVIVGKVPNASNVFTGSHSRYIDFTHETSFTDTSLKQIFSATGYTASEIRESRLFVFYWNPLNYLGLIGTYLLKNLQLAIHKLYGNFSVSIVSNTIIFKFYKKD